MLGVGYRAVSLFDIVKSFCFCFPIFYDEVFPRFSQCSLCTVPIVMSSEFALVFFWIPSSDEEDARGLAKNVSWYTLRIPNIWRLIVAA